MTFILAVLVIILVVAFCLGVDYFVMLALNFLGTGHFHVTFLQVVIGMLLLGVIGSVLRGPGTIKA